MPQTQVFIGGMLIIVVIRRGTLMSGIRRACASSDNGKLPPIVGRITGGSASPMVVQRSRTAATTFCTCGCVTVDFVGFVAV